MLFSTDGQRFLCGHDERFWYVSAIDAPVSSVRAAKQSLIPPEIWEDVQHLPPDEYDNRNNDVFKRQGEWFFIPVNRDIPENLIFKNEAIRRSSGSKPHICQELYREGGETVYIVGGKEYSAEEYKKMKEKKPNFDDVGVRTMQRDASVYVRGYVKHEDHSTIVLNQWHRVFINREVTSFSVGFLD